MYNPLKCALEHSQLILFYDRGNADYLYARTRLYLTIENGSVNDGLMSSAIVASTANKEVIILVYNGRKRTKAPSDLLVARRDLIAGFQ